jgi:hypothetical protein
VAASALGGETLLKTATVDTIEEVVGLTGGTVSLEQTRSQCNEWSVESLLDLG